MNRMPWLILLLLLGGGCGQPQKKYVLQLDLQKLAQADIYEKETVYDVIFDAEELPIDSIKLQSRQLFLKGIDLYKNKKNPEAAIKLFKESILVFPEAKTYFELGSALLETPSGGQEAIKAFEVAEYLKFDPKARVQFSMAQAYSQLAQNELKDSETYAQQADYYLLRAFEEGFSDSASVLQDPILRQEFRSPRFRYQLADLKARQVTGLPNDLFSLFLRSFQKVKQPYEIPVEKVNMKGFDRSISYEFAQFIPEMQNSSFGRDVSHDFFYVANVAQTPTYTALLYSSVSFYEEDMQPVLTRLATFTPQGKIISSVVFSCQCSAENVKKGRLENNLLTVEELKRKWKHPIDKVPFEENQVTGYEPIATSTFRITEAGEIVEEEGPVTPKPSGTLAIRN